MTLEDKEEKMESSYTSALLFNFDTFMTEIIDTLQCPYIVKRPISTECFRGCYERQRVEYWTYINRVGN